MSTLTTEEAAALVGVSPFTVRKWVTRGYLRPVRANVRPSLFRESDVVECRYERMSQAEHDRLDMLWAEVLASA